MIKRVLEAWPEIEFVDDRDGCLFTAIVHRTSVKGPISAPSSPKSSPKTEEQILDLIRQDPFVTTVAMGAALGITKRAVLKQIDKLKVQGRLRRVGPAKGGPWEVIE